MKGGRGREGVERGKRKRRCREVERGKEIVVRWELEEKLWGVGRGREVVESRKMKRMY